MNALLIFPEFPLSFWSFPNLIKLSIAKSLHYPLGLMTMAALLPEDWQMRLVDLNVRELTEDDWNWSDIVMFSGMYVQRTGLLSLVREGKQRAKLTVSGGSYPTLVPDELIQAGCDYVVCGEAENTMDLFLAALTEGQTGLIIKNNSNPDLTRSPVPRYDLIEPSDYREFYYKPLGVAHLIVNSVMFPLFLAIRPAIKHRTKLWNKWNNCTSPELGGIF